ncbi:MAG TPA: hypothetical protein VIK32_02560, partial [Candidatus Limnocylindrales bacterium]
MVKRIAALAIVLAAFLIVAVPAFAANGARADYTTSDACATCHQTVGGVPASAPKVYNDWAATAHGTDAEGHVVMGTSNGLPYGSVCGGCHTANFDPTKVVPILVSGTYVPSVSTTTAPQASGTAPFSENDIGCSSCHYGANVASMGALANTGSDSNDTAHTAAFADLANAEICGACHSRYSYTVNPITVLATPTSTASPTQLIQPQMAIGYAMLGVNYQPLSAVLNIPVPGWSPTPNPAATTAAGLMTYWQIDGKDTVWQNKGHDGSAAQYPEWNSEGLAFGHADSLTKLKDAMGPNPPASCLECHSADYRIAVEAGKTPPTGAQAKYGITCVGCHKPHDAGTAKGAWDEAFDTQLITDNAKTLCVECHNGEIPAGTTASPGAEVHHPMKEMMDGY